MFAQLMFCPVFSGVIMNIRLSFIVWPKYIPTWINVMQVCNILQLSFEIEQASIS